MRDIQSQESLNKEIEDLKVKELEILHNELFNLISTDKALKSKFEDEL